MSETHNELIQWLKNFEKCVQNVDFETAREMFYPDAYCFGSYTEIMYSLDELIEKQWKMIWPNSEGFHFDIEKMNVKSDLAQTVACIMVPWVSTGFQKNGSPFKRPGRCTLFLKKDPATNTWKATHSHYSLRPGTRKSTKDAK